MFNYKKCSIAALALLLSGSIFAADFDPMKAHDQYKTTFASYGEVDSAAPERPTNVPTEAFYARHFFGSEHDMWVVPSARYYAPDYDAFTGKPHQLAPVFPSAIDDSLMPNKNHINGWYNIDGIYRANGTQFFALEFWRAYCNTHNPEIMRDEFPKYAELYEKIESQFAVIINKELLEAIINKSYQPQFTGPGRKLLQLDTMQEHIIKIMHETGTTAKGEPLELSSMQEFSRTLF